MRNQYVSEAVVKRLPMYYRYLESLEEQGIVRISSRELSERMGLTASQIRQDINSFGGFGQQGFGYLVTELKKRIGEVLGLDAQYHMIVVGAGNIGTAIANYEEFGTMGFHVRRLFDVDKTRVGKEERISCVDELSQYLRENVVDIGIIATPAEVAQDICDILCEGNVRGIWNFAPVDLRVPEGVAANHVHLSDSLLVLSYHCRELSGQRV